MAGRFSAVGCTWVMAISSSMRWRRSKPVMTLSFTVARMPSAIWNCGAAAGACGAAPVAGFSAPAAAGSCPGAVWATADPASSAAMATPVK